MPALISESVGSYMNKVLLLVIAERTILLSPIEFSRISLVVE